jgi:hypothetical protein
LFFAPDPNGDTDYGFNWYKHIGMTIIYQMALEVLRIVGKFIVMTGYNKFLQWKDRGYTNDRNISRQKTVQAYVRLYSGPDYLIH